MLDEEGSTFTPSINPASTEIANNLMLKYYGKGFKSGSARSPRREKVVP